MDTLAMGALVTLAGAWKIWPHRGPFVVLTGTMAVIIAASAPMLF